MIVKPHVDVYTKPTMTGKESDRKT